ncbi:MAG: hypothetical protein AB4352_11890 [Hormoscilla sp.]
MTSSTENQPEEIYNQPGLLSLSYRITRHDDSLRRMLAQLHTQTSPPDDKKGDRPLAKLTTSHRNDPAIALLDGWATVMEVLTFYQERIANEGFVNTATERLSVLELSRTVGYELDPGVAASTHLAFTIEESDDVPEIVIVPEGVRVESVPIADEDPQIFETIETLEMRGAWNILQPYFPSVTIPQEIGEDTVELKLSGTETELAEGDALLVVEEQVEPYESRYLTLLAVEPNDEEDYTLVSWSGGLGWEPRSEIQVHSLPEQATLFGSDAPDWNELSPEEKRLYGHDTGGVFSYINTTEWKSISTGLLKNADVRALVRETHTGSLFVGTHNGIFRSRDEGKNWVEMNRGLTNIDIYSLAVNEKGYLFAGATEGNVFRSIDLGESWVEIGSGGVSIVIQYQVPSVDSLQSAADTLKGAADSLEGAADSLDGGEGNAEEIIRGAETTTRNAETTTRGAAATLDTLPGDVEDYDAWVVKKTKYIETSLPSSIIRCLAVYDNIIYAGTEYGIFGSQDSGRKWKDLNKGDNEPPEVSGDITELSGHIVYAIARIDHQIFVGTDGGVFYSNADSNGWIDGQGWNDNGMSTQIAYSLVALQEEPGYLFAGTKAGVFIRTMDEGTWVQKNNGEMTSETTVYSLSVVSNESSEYIYAGTNQGVFYSQVTTPGDAVNVTWTKINNGLINRDIRSILGYADGGTIALLAGSWFDRLYTTEWPGFELADRQDIDLNGTYENILAGSWLVLTHDDRYAKNRSQAYKVKRAATVLANDFGQNGKITRIYLETGEGLIDFGGEKYRETEVKLESVALELFEEVIQEEPPVEGDEIELDKVVPGLEAKRKIIISGKQMRVRIPPMGGVVRQSLLSDKTWATLVNDLTKDGQKDWTYTDVNDLLVHKESHREKIFAGTGGGVLTLELGSDIWLELTSIRSVKYYDEGETRYILAGTAAGVFRYDGTSWSHMNTGLKNTDVRALEIYEDVEGNISIIAGTGGGVFIYDDKNDKSSQSWREIDRGLKNTDVWALEISDRHYVSRLVLWTYIDEWVRGDLIIWAGTGGGVFRYENDRWESMNDEKLINLEVRDLQMYEKYGEHIILAGTARGVFKHNNSSWFELEKGLTSKDVRAIKSYRESGIDYILAGTAEGVFRHNGGSWIELENGLTSKNVRVLKIDETSADRTIWAGTAAGLFAYNVSNDSNDSGWQEVTGWENADVRTIAIEESETEGDRIILAGTAGGVGTGGGVSRLGNDNRQVLTADSPENVSAVESYADNDNIYILAGTESGIFRRQVDEIKWEKFDRDGLSNEKVKALEIYAEKGDRYLLAGTEGGIFRLNLDEANGTWEDITHDLAKKDVLAVATYAESGVRTIFVGTSLGDVFSLKSDSQSWIQFDNSLPNERDVQSLATYELRGDRYLFAGTGSGVFRLQLGKHAWEEYNQDLTDRNALALEIYDDSGDISLLAGTSTGLFGLDLKDVTASWRPFSDSWPHDDKTVQDLKTYNYNDLRYILIANGTGSIFTRDYGGNSWQDIPDEGLTNSDVRSLKIYQYQSNNYLLAGTAGGIFRRELDGQTWNRFDNGLTNTDVYALERYEKDEEFLLAGTAEDVCRRQMGEKNWQKLARGWINRQVRALKIYEHDSKLYILAGTESGVFYLELNGEEQWHSLNNDDSSEQRLQDKDVRTLDIYEQNGQSYILAGTKSGVFSGLLVSENGKDTAIWTPQNQLLTNTDVYSLAVYTEAGETTLFAGTRGGNIYRWHIDRQDSSWEQMRQGLANDVRAIALSSQGQVFIGTGNLSILKGTESVEGTQMLPGDSLSILRRRELTDDGTLKEAMPSRSDVDPGSKVHWDLIDRLGFKGEITTAPEEIILEAATEADKTISEVASLRNIIHGQMGTQLQLEEPLINSYDRTTVTINGNVALVTHGETISDEVLGSGDGSKINQEFVLKNPPLTYITADTASGSESTLTVRVDGLLWKEVFSLYQLKSAEQSYMTRIDDDGQTRIIFGDGYRGARPTTGQENITATYRSGLGPDGEVEANTITLVQTAPLGVVEVTNPQAATGAAPPETRAEARHNAPLNTLSLDRIISLRDYEYFVGGFSGIGKAQAAELKTQQGNSMVQVTIAGRNGDEVARDSNLYTQIVEAVDDARDPTLRAAASGSASEFSLDSYQLLLFNIEAKLWINWQYLASAVIPEVEKALQEEFTFEKRAFAQDVTAAEIVQLIQSINGVDGVDLDALYLKESDRQLNQILEAQPAYWDGLEVQPAELLLLNPAAGSIDLQEVIV